MRSQEFKAGSVRVGPGLGANSLPKLKLNRLTEGRMYIHRMLQYVYITNTYMADRRICGCSPVWGEDTPKPQRLRLSGS